MEGVITAAYRRLFKKYFGGIDRYYTPFIAANQTHTFKEREKRELSGKSVSRQHPGA